MNLLTIKSSSDLLNAKFVMEQTGLEHDILWTDGIDLGSEKSFYWASTGEDFVNAPWHGTQPNNDYGKENCVGIVEWYLKFGIIDDDCNKQFHFICSQSTQNIDVKCAIYY